MNKTFDIRIVAGDQPKAVITIGDFVESCPLVGDWPASQYQTRWIKSLQSLVQGQTSVALPLGTRISGLNDAPLIWVFFRDSEDVFVQQVMLAPGSEWEIGSDGELISSAPRETMSEDGEPISEWQTDVDAIRQFLNSTEG